MFQVMPVTLTAPAGQPTMSVVGRTCGVDPGAQDSTAGTGVVVVLVRGEVVVDTRSGVVEDPVALDLAGGEEPEPTFSPMAIPTPRATRTRTAPPTRTMVLRRTVMTRGSLSVTNGYGTSRRPHFEEWGTASVHLERMAGTAAWDR